MQTSYTWYSSTILSDKREIIKINRLNNNTEWTINTQNWTVEMNNKIYRIYVNEAATQQQNNNKDIYRSTYNLPQLINEVPF